MISLIKRKFYHIKNFLKRILRKIQYNNNDNLDSLENKSNVIIRSFIGIDKICVTHKNIIDRQIVLPLNTQIDFNIDNIEEEVNRFYCIQNFYFLYEKKYLKKRLVIYQNTSNLLLGILDYIISKKKFPNYHIFCNNISAYNCNLYLQKKYNNVVLNTIEDNENCMYRIIRNEWEDYYNTDKNNDIILIFFSRENSIQEIARALFWIKECYVCLPYNSFLIKLLQFIFRRDLIINIELISSNYCILKSNIDKYKYIDTEKVINIIEKKYSEFKEKYFPILFPMYYSSSN